MMHFLKVPALLALSLALSVILFLTGKPAAAKPVDLEWTVTDTLELNDAALDFAVSPDGTLVFVLSSGRVDVYYGGGSTPLKQIPVDKGYNRITFNPANQTLMLSNPSAKTLSVMEIEPVQRIVTKGSPFKGDENARVTLAIFDDYQ